MPTIKLTGINLSTGRMCYAESKRLCINTSYKIFLGLKMPTIKLTGINLSTGRISKAGTTDDVVTDGSLTIGDANTDSIVVNAEFDSDLIPDDDVTYDLGSASKKWRTGYFDQVHAKLRHVNTSKYRNEDNTLQYVRWDSTGSNGSPGVNNKFIAPANGELMKVSVRATSAPGATNVAFHKSANGTSNLNTTAQESVGVDMASANTTYTVNLTNSSFSAGEILGVSIDPTNTPNDVNVTCVWLFDWS
jgi:hypothetical protein